MNNYGFSSLSKILCRTKHIFSLLYCGRTIVLLQRITVIFIMVFWLNFQHLESSIFKLYEFFGPKFSDTSIRKLTFYHYSCIKFFFSIPYSVLKLLAATNIAILLPFLLWTQPLFHSNVYPALTAGCFF